MVRTPVTFRDATSDASGRVHFPEVVAAFEALGFRRLGRLERVYPGGVDGAARAYGEEHRALFHEHKVVPMMVLVAGDGSAFVLVDWWWGMPDVRIRTPMADGSVVETWRAWDGPPVLPKVLDRVRDTLDLAAEQTLSSVPAGGRGIALVAGTSAELWAAHQSRVESWARARSTRPAVSGDMKQATELSRRLSAHDFRVIHRISRIQAALVVMLFALPVLVVFRAWFGDPMTWTDVTVIMVGLLLWVVVARFGCRLLPRIRYLRSVRPRFVS